ALFVQGHAALRYATIDGTVKVVEYRFRAVRSQLKHRAVAGFTADPGRAVKIALLVENGSDIIGFKAVRGTGKDVENRLDVFLPLLLILKTVPMPPPGPLGPKM